MASTVTQLQRLILTAQEVKEETGWSWEMVEDYVNILRDLVLLAESIDANINNLESSLQQNANNEALIAFVRSRINTLGDMIEASSVQETPVTVNYTTVGNEVVVCNNVAPITITLNLLPKELESVSIVRRDALVTVSGPVNGGTSFKIRKRYDSPKITFADAEWSIV